MTIRIILNGMVIAVLRYAYSFLSYQNYSFLIGPICFECFNAYCLRIYRSKA